MTNIFGTLNIGKVALTTQQTVIDVTGHNIANVNTPGYTRQRVNMTNTSITGYQGMTVGSGVKIEDIERVYNNFVEQQIKLENQQLGYWESKKSALDNIEMIFNEASGYGIAKAMNEFWGAWNDLSNNPSGYAERVALLTKSETLAFTLNQAYIGLNEIQQNLTSTLASDLDQINQTAAYVKDLNSQIMQAEVSGYRANDLRDQRDSLIKELSSMIDIETTEDVDGNISVFVGGGHPLVSPVNSWELATATNPDPALEDIIVWESTEGSTVDITEKINDGSIKGMLDVRDITIPDYQNRLNDLAEGLINGINNVHTTGEDLNGDPGGVFFNLPDVDEPAKYMAVGIDDPELIVAAAVGGGIGDNTVALSIAELQENLTMDGNSATYSDFFQSLVSDVGIATQYADTNYENQEIMLTQLKNHRESISGVSLDEEMVNLTKFQHAYQAAAQLINTVDEMLEALISLA